MNEEPTDVYLPPSFPFPIKIVSIDAASSGDVSRGTRLLSYSFVHIPKPPAEPETRFGTWDSALEGSVQSWNFKPGDVISAKRAKDRPALIILEPCKHGMQLGGLCVVCGKDMTTADYIGFSDASRASIQMNHSATGPTVSLEVAEEMGRDDAQRLQKAKKLSLIVDLDQTIVHATVDPTVGEWITEGEAWETKHSNQASSSSEPNNDAKEEEEDECNPNWEALKDVKKFTLAPEVMLGKGKGKALEASGTIYYIKPRPGWQKFFKELGLKYEMHVYTMGTRAYAEQVCKAIDPEGTVFGRRILTRDESGSLTQKSLHRLFPVDTSMVVIIDDRADVWEWSPNLVKVIPYDFFVGIGDINSTFLPKQESITAAVPSSPPESPKPITTPSPQEDADAAAAAEEAQQETSRLLTKNSLALEAQVEERPLAKKSEEIQDHEQDSSNGSTPDLEEETQMDTVESKSDEIEGVIHERHHRKALLKNDDVELHRVQMLLEEVHQRYFEAYDSSLKAEQKSKDKGKTKALPSPQDFDVTRIIPDMRSQVFQGLHVLFSSVIPLGTAPETTEIWRMAHMFGARCHTEVNNLITHVVAAKDGTIKVDTAKRRGGIHIVTLAWFTDSVAYWQRQDEATYYLDGPPGPKNLEADPALNEWGNGGSASGLELDVDWADINDEVDAAMNESDDDDETRSRNGERSEDEWSEASISRPSTPSRRKRPRSSTPSDAGGESDNSNRSPLAKRKKIAAERSGMSRLKDAITADDLQSKQISTPSSERSFASADSDDDDFLARELG